MCLGVFVCCKLASNQTWYRESQYSQYSQRFDVLRIWSLRPGLVTPSLQVWRSCSNLLLMCPQIYSHRNYTQRCCEDACVHIPEHEWTQSVLRTPKGSASTQLTSSDLLWPTLLRAHVLICSEPPAQYKHWRSHDLFLLFFSLGGKVSELYFTLSVCTHEDSHTKTMAQLFLR